MRKYLELARLLFKAQLVYRFDVAMTALGTIGRALFAFILWGAVYAGRDTVAGLSFQAMLSYYLASSFLASIEMSSGVSGEVSASIRGGTFSKNMVIPANPMAYFLASNFGASAYYAVFSAIAALFCAFAFGIRPSAADPASMVCALAMVLLGLTFMVCYQFSIGILAFKFQDISFFWHVQNNLIAFCTGAIFPLILLPAPVLGALRFLPFTYVTYLPAMLLTGQASAQEGLFGLAVLAAWTLATVCAGQAAYRHMRIKYDGVGI